MKPSSTSSKMNTTPVPENVRKQQSRASGSRGNPTQEHRPKHDYDDRELTTTNVMPRSLSTASSFSEIGQDAWQELGEKDFPLPVLPRPMHKERNSNRSLYTPEPGNETTKSGAEAKAARHRKDGEALEVSENAERRNTSVGPYVTSGETSGREHKILQKDCETNDCSSTISTSNVNGSKIENQIPKNAANPKEKNQDQSITSVRRTPSRSNTSVASRSLPRNEKNDLRKAMKEYGNKISRENRSGRKRSVTPPGKRRISVFDGPMSSKGTSITPKLKPLLCDFVQAESKKAATGRNNHHVFVTDKEYHLLQKFLPPLQKKSYQLLEKDKDEVQVKTLFGWVSAPLYRDTESVLESQEYTISEPGGSEICDEPGLTPANATPTDGLLLASESPSYHDVGEGTDDPEYLIRLSKTSSCDSEAQTHLLSEIEWKLMQMYDSNPTSQHKLHASGNDQLEVVAAAMKQSILSASEASVVLTKTMFKSALTDPATRQSLNQNQQFQEFVNSKNEVEALEKAASIYSSAHGSIQSYLNQLRKDSSSSSKWSDPKRDEQSIASARRNVKSPRIANAVFRQMSSIEPTVPKTISPRTTETGQSQETIPTHGPRNFQLSILAKPGIILETIHCNNYEFSMVYSGGVDRVNLLESAVREKSEAIPLHPQRLLEMIDRNATFASGRIISSKYYISFVTSQLSSLVRNFMDGSLAVRMNRAMNRNIWDPKLVAKLQSLNIFSGIILQAATAFFAVVKKMKTAIEKAMRLDDVLKVPRLPGLTMTARNSGLSQPPSGSVNITQEYGLPLGTKMPMKQTIADLSSGVKEIDTILVTIKNSLESLNFGVKVKKMYRKRIEYFFMAVKQLESGHEIDFGTVIMCLVCNAALVQSLVHNIVPSVDVEMRSRILSNLGHLNWGSGELVKVVKKICLLSSFVSTKSIGRLRKMIIMKRMRKFSKHKWFQPPGKYLLKDMPLKLKANTQIVDEQREETEHQKLRQLKEDLANVDALT